VPDVDRTNRNT